MDNATMDLVEAKRQGNPGVTSPLMRTYAPLPVTFVRGEGARLWDAAGREYLDAVAGVGVNAVGHAHPRVIEAIREQAGLVLHTSNLYEQVWQQRLAERLTTLSGMRAAFFANSGAEANEAALKLARLHAARRGIAQPLVVVMENAFHGRTFATLSASDSPAVQAGFAPLVDGFLRVPFGDIDALRTRTATCADRVVAVLVEPVQGEGGVQIPPDGYLRALRAVCDRHDWLLMLDEVQTGLGRTGKWFAFQHEGIVPDVLTLAKALGGGMPIGACLAAGAAAELFAPGSHGSTFGGNPLACRVACTVLDIIEDAALVDNAARQGAALLAGLRAALADVDGVEDIRGKGLMIGIDMTAPCAYLPVAALRTQGLLINVTRARTVRLLPPLLLDNGQTRRVVRALRSMLVDTR
ncbi:aspartate aminotransferase family protein [Robbsia sp. Bb-Pol-6]|uniref:Acetylornithine aminotransferase n=1 Tax=Robbsia betulipollinis TaxID=2981849 RepID=A0ABT3ZHT4_9BURK|nr:aspartate aminotransferase family protein [Robbsia betulipollinis]MCY0386022.1 aspartate aminotransferase family protein [Robbsia betulipollinis]